MRQRICSVEYVSDSLATTVFLLVALAAAVIDWMAVARSNSRLEYIAKPLTTCALIAVALTLDVSQDASFAFRIAALGFCLLGDIFLMLPRDAFIAGLGSFAVAQVLFTASFFSADSTTRGLIVGLVIAVPVAILLSRRFVTAIQAKGHGKLVGPVIVYVIVISAMAVAAMSAGRPVAIGGAALFLMSDSLIAESRFVRQRRWHGVGIMVTYHLALVGLVFGLL